MAADHWVHQGYLRHFADKDEKFFAYDKGNRKSFPTKVKAVAKEKGFDDLPPNNPLGGQKAISDWLVGFESEFTPQHNELIEQLNTGVFNRAKFTEPLAEFIAVQSVRTRYRRSELVGMQKVLQQIIGTNLVHPCGSEVPMDLSKAEENAPLDHAMAVFGFPLIPELTDAIVNHIWFIGQNDTDQPLYTSDNPVFRRCHDPRQHAVGFITPGSETVLPLSSRFILVLWERSFFQEYAHIDGSILPMKPTMVAEYNGHQAYASQRQIYCLANKFERVEEVLKESPDLADPARMKFRVGGR